MRRAPAPVPPPAERLAFLEGIRGLAALYVAVSHVFTMVDPAPLTGAPSTAPEWIRHLAAPFLYGHIAVALFIVVSGFSLQLGLLQSGSGEVRSLSGFFRRRALRILPAYYACLAVSTVVAWGITSHFSGIAPFNIYLPVDTGAILSHVFLVQNLSPAWMYKINGVLWTISLEVQLYLLFPLFAKLQANRGRGVLLFVGGLLGLGLNVLLPASLRLWFAFLFVVGMAAAHLAYRPPLRGRRVELWVGTIGWLGLTLGVCAVAFAPDHAASDVPFGIALACLCALGTVGGGGRLIRLLGARPIATLGSFSYSLYLVHHPVEQIVFALRPPGVDAEGPLLAWLGLVGLPLMIAAGWLFSLAFERPVVRRRPVRLPRSRRTVPATLPLPGKLPSTPLGSPGERGRG
jgi:peptidoglycan/LPS O-acetylase OafA/YrhL